MTAENNRLKALVDLAVGLCTQNDYQEMLRIVVQKGATLLTAEVASLMMINPKTRQTVKTVYKEQHKEPSQQHQKLQTQISGWIIQNHQSFMSVDIRSDPRFRKNLFAKEALRKALGVPLLAEDLIIGTLIILKKDDWHEIEKELQLLEQFSAIAAPFLRNVQRIQEYFEAPIPENALLKKYKSLGMLGQGKKFVELLKAIESAARCDVRVLLEGKSGTGKELIARAIHKLSARGSKPFVAIDCGAIPANLIESELFGHVRGAFTGANTERKGLIMETNGGTLFMDEIGNLPMDIQAKLLRVLQEGEVRPLGSNKSVKVDVRIISAGSASLQKMVANKQFREDLFYRLYVYPIDVPSLNERWDDIPLLANHFLKRFSIQQNKEVESFHEEILDFMQQRNWAGNIRELENFVERLVTSVSANAKVLDRSFLPKDLLKELKIGNVQREDIKVEMSLHESLAEYEEQLLRQALQANNWNQSKTARKLRIAEHTLRYKMGKLGIVRMKE